MKRAKLGGYMNDDGTDYIGVLVHRIYLEWEGPQAAFVIFDDALQQIKDPKMLHAIIIVESWVEWEEGYRYTHRVQQQFRLLTQSMSLVLYHGYARGVDLNWARRWLPYWFDEYGNLKPFEDRHM